MTGPGGGGKLYTPELLALAVSLADHPLDGDLPMVGEAVSRTCGSTVAVGLAATADGRIERVGLRVSACAVGQSAAAIFARGAEGRSADEIEAAEVAIGAWFEGGPLPEWPGFSAIAAAQDYPGRHGAILLPWRAARDALSKVAQSG